MVEINYFKIYLNFNFNFILGMTFFEVKVKFFF
jgi:hypothetical protein